jgi:TnpA family transposase
MSTSNTMPPSEAIPPSRRRPPSFILPEDPSPEDLAQAWTLSDRDKAEVLRCRGDAQRRRFAVQLCTLRIYGRFLPEAVAAPVAITNHLARQLGLPLVLFEEVPGRFATETEHWQRIRAYLGWQSFDETARTRLTHWLTQRATDDLLPSDLMTRAEDILRVWQIVLPARSTLEELVAPVTARVQDDVYSRIVAGLSPMLQHAIDALLHVAPGERTSMLFQLKEYPPEASSAVMLRYIERYQFLHTFGVEAISLRGISPPMVRYLADLATRYDARALRRFPATKRLALTACFLVEIHKTILDHIVALHDQLLTKKLREARHAFEERHRQLRRHYKPGLMTLITTGKTLLDPTRSPATTLGVLLHELKADALREAVDICEALHQLEERGEIDALRARYPGLRRYLPAFFALPFQGEPGSEPVLAGLDLVSQLDAGTLKTLPGRAPIAFVPRKFWPALAGTNGTLDRRTWELGLAAAVRDGLRSGDVYLPASRRHVSFAHLVYDPTRWTTEREDAYTELQLPQAPEDFLARLPAGIRYRGPPSGTWTAPQSLCDHSPRPVASETAGCPGGPPTTHTPPGERAPRIPNFSMTLLATLIAHGTNLGLATMAHSVEGMSADMLQEMSQWCLRTDTLKAANAVLVNAHHRMQLSVVWGDGSISSSDGQRFGLHASSLLGSLYPRYFGYYDRALTVYTHIADQQSVFHTQVIACSVREALYVLDGLLDNNTILRPKEHMVDQHGFTDQLFGLCHLLGYTLMPRLPVHKQQLYKLDHTKQYGHLDAVIHGTVDIALIQEQWDQLVRVAASLRNRTAPVHVVLQRLAGSAPSDRLAKALATLGRVLRTMYLLRYIHDETLRGRMQLQLNRGERRHQLARRLFFANQGAFQTGDYEEIMNKATCLSLLSNAVLVWNTVHMTRLIAQLRATGETIVDEDVARISPAAFAHVIPNGTYFVRPTPLERDEDSGESLGLLNEGKESDT